MLKTTRKFFIIIWQKIRNHMKFYRSAIIVLLFKLMLFMEELIDEESDYEPNNPLDQFEGDIDFGVYEWECCIEYASLIRDNLLINAKYPMHNFSLSFKSEKTSPLHKIIFEYCARKCGVKLSSCETVLDEVVFTVSII